MEIYLIFFVFYILFLRFFIPNPFFAFLIFYLFYSLIDRQFVALPKAFQPFKNRRRVKTLKNEIAINPSNMNAYFELGMIYLAGKKFTESVNCFLKAADKMGDYGEVYFLLGKAQYLQGDQEAGIENIKKAIAKESKIGYGEPYIYLLVEELKGNGDPERIEELLSLLHRFGTPEIFYKTGQMIKSRDKNLARQMFRMVLESYGGTPGHFKRMHRRWAILARLRLLL